MKNSIQLFKNEQFGEFKTIIDREGNALFCLADLCSALKIANVGNVKNRLDEDYIRQADVTDSVGRKRNIIFVTEAGMWNVILRSDSKEAKPMQKWITDEVLPSLRKNGFYIMPDHRQIPQHLTPTKVRASIEWVKGVKETLNLNDSSTLLMLKQVGEPLGLPTPDYTPSRGQLLSPTILLQQHGVNMNAREFNRKMVEVGFIKELERPSSKGKIKHFKSLTEKGALYGENQVNPNNPKETQPLYYKNKFADLLSVLELKEVNV